VNQLGAMTTNDESQRQIGELRSRVAELSEQLRIARAERDAARLELSRLLGGGTATTVEAARPEANLSSDLVICAFCDGEGVYWVHDFEMQCKRCNGTGSVARATDRATPDFR
jgi:hypothetical protein